MVSVIRHARQRHVIINIFKNFKYLDHTFYVSIEKNGNE